MNRDALIREVAGAICETRLLPAARPCYCAKAPDGDMCDDMLAGAQAALALIAERMAEECIRKGNAAANGKGSVKYASGRFDAMHEVAADLRALGKGGA